MALRRASLAVCRREKCSWNGIRFPLRGITEYGTFVCSECNYSMRLEEGMPHPINYIEALIWKAGQQQQYEEVVHGT